jgi:plasmid stabilization system protein ParE
MKIVFEDKFLNNFNHILDFIAQDKKSASIKFKSQIKKKIGFLPQAPYIHRKSFYFQDDTYRDLIYKGYTIIYKIQTDTIIILDIFKWTDVK